MALWSYLAYRVVLRLNDIRHIVWNVVYAHLLIQQYLLRFFSVSGSVLGNGD